MPLPPPAQLKTFRSSLPTFQIFAANTGVGKTIFSASLCRAAARLPLLPYEKQRLKSSGSPLNRKVFYIKPVQTGFPVDSDARHVKTYAPGVETDVIFTYKEPAGAHLTAVREGKPVSDVELLRATEDRLARAAAYPDPAIAFLETAGGVNSPVMSGTLQCQAYRPLRLPSLLIGDSTLGGVSTTLSAYESLLIRGYDIAGILMFDSPRYQNHAAIRQSVESNIPVYLFSPPPPFPTRPGDTPGLDEQMLDATNMMVYYEDADKGAMAVVEDMLTGHSKRFERLESMAKEGEKKVWWPFTQHGDVGRPTVIDSAYQESFSVYNPETPEASSQTSSSLKVSGTTSPQYDGCASWWTQTFGHADAELTLAAAHAAGRYGHVMFPECINEPALQLSERLLETAGKGWASRVFFSDNGSTAIEVAIKASLKKTEKAMKAAGTWKNQTLGVMGVEGSYHGDTMGCMDACGPNTYNAEINWYKPRGLWFNPPSFVMKDGKYTLRLPTGEYPDCKPPTFATLDEVFALERTELLDHYQNYIRAVIDKHQESAALGALIIEPIVLGAGGMVFVDPLFQRALIHVARSLSIPLPVIYDEVMVGFHRLGMGLASPGVQLLGETPDLACYAKCLTGGLLPLAVTVVKEDVWEVFRGTGKTEALLHGHSYTAHPMGCAVANKTLEKFSKMGGNRLGGVECMNKIWDSKIVRDLSYLPNVDGVVSFGSILSVELRTDTKGYAASHVSANIIRKLRANGVYARPLGNVVYVMAPVVNLQDQREKDLCRWVESVFVEVLEAAASA
ncbi:pyridoxal phosphate-dependent transferase [Phlyctochytrium arcticum]|nr:pyridoxal phosphate-dependent transferase [Phlyctochytrium arcticum]